MEVIQKLISSTKRLAIEEEDLKDELIRLKTQLVAEEVNLSMATADCHGLVQQNAMLEQFQSLADKNLEMITKFQDVAKSSMMVHSFLEVFIEKTQPTTQQQREVLAQLMQKKEKMLRQYETSQTYDKILEEDLKERELNKLIEEKRNELIKLTG